jgi:trimeric autotransporter adhesin
MKTTIKFTCLALAALALVCFAALSTAQAVTPPPDGGYPGFNTADGDNALLNFNTAVGVNNTAVGVNALREDTNGAYNVAIGSGSLQSNTTGFQNMAIGAEALANNLVGNFNMAIGFRALFMNTGNRNSAVGAAALRNNTTASDNTAIGSEALRENQTGFQNTAIGANALSENTTGVNNTAIGFRALANNTSSGNTATGWTALARNKSGGANTADGDAALWSNTVGGGNTAIGFDALLYSSGDGNIALGGDAGIFLTTGDFNIYIGNQGKVSESRTIRIGDPLNQSATFIAGISGATVTGTAVVVNGNGKLGVAPSSARFKEAIKSMDNASEALFSLKPVTFRYKKEIDPAGTSQSGLIAEEVAKVNPALVVPDKDGRPYTVRYDAVNAMLLNEFLKEHKAFVAEQRKVQELEANAAKQQKQIEALTAGLQKVSAQLELNKPAPQTVLNDQ